MMNKINDKIITASICIVAILFGIIVKCMPAYYFLQGKKNFDKQEYVKAYQNLKQAYNFDRQNKDYRYYYVMAMVHLSPNYKIQKSLFDIANSSQKDSAQQLAQHKIYEIKNSILKNVGENYIEQVPINKKIIRWDKDTFPLKTIILNETDKNFPDFYITEIQKAFSQWQKSTSFIKFSETNDKNKADIIVKLSNLPADVCSKNICQYVVGHTTPQYKGNYLKSMTIVLYTTDPFGNYFSDKELYNTILHEIGHALGIMGHSYNSGDLMYMSSDTKSNIYTPFRSSFQYLSSKDLNTIKLLYNLVPDITNSKEISKKGLIYAPVIIGSSAEISERKLKEAQNYIKNAPHLSGGYIDLGIAYSEANNLDEAIKATQKAYSLAKTDTEKHTALFNLANYYFQKKDYYNAEECAIRAQEISQSEELDELLSTIRSK